MDGRSSPSNRSKDVLEALSPVERSGVLRALLERHPELESEAREIASAGLSAVSIEDVAQDVFDAVTSMPEEATALLKKGWDLGGIIAKTSSGWRLFDVWNLSP